MARLALGMSMLALGCPSAPPRFGGGAAEGVGEGAVDDGDGDGDSGGDEDLSGGTGMTGDPCDEINACALGWMCSAPTIVPGCRATACCNAYCDVNAMIDTCVPDGQSCFPYFMNPPAGYENVGICVEV